MLRDDGGWEKYVDADDGDKTFCYYIRRESKQLVRDVVWL